jgi:adenosylcobinamide-GDP ribazoletransferase
LLVLVLLLQLAALVRLGPMVPMALIVASALARVSPLWAMARFAYLRVNGTAGFHRKHHKGLGEAVPTLILLVLGSPLLKQLPLLSVPICVLCSILVAEWLGRRLGGMTGDGYGAVVMLSETFILLLMALLAPLVGSGGG